MSKPASVTAHRGDLQGLRAVAVLLVALNHARVPFLPGGYVGVDIFFVLSGYFITGLLLRDGFGDEGGPLGRVSISRFYARRARRILPAACLTLLVTSLAAYVVYDVLGHDFLATKPVLQDVLSASLFFANLHFIAGANDYFAQATTILPSPVQHFWSLSVEEQFYLVWPTVLAGTFLLCRRHVSGAARRGLEALTVERRRRLASWIIGTLIVGGSAASLGWSIHETATDPNAAYYSTPVRVWEFGCGAGLALLAARPRPLPRVVLSLLGWVGAAMIATAAVLYSSTTAFPGDAALLPVLGAGLIILAGMLPTRLWIARALSVRPLAYIGDRSYTFYLWHYPVLVIAWQMAGHALGVADNLALLAGAFALSIVTFAGFENPLRVARWLRGWRTAIMAPVSLGAAVLAVVIPLGLFDGTLAAEAAASHRAHVNALAPARGQPAPKSLSKATPIPAVGAAAKAARRGAPLPKAIVPSMQELERENVHISYGMHRGCQPGFATGIRDQMCRLGDPSAKRVVTVIGDSHGGMWMPALIAIARRQHFAVVPLDKAGCLLNDIHKNLPNWPCAKWYGWAVRADRRLRPVATIVAFEYTPKLLSEPATAVGDLRAVLAQVPHGVILADPPGQTSQPAQCIAESGATMRTCSSRLSSRYVPFMHALHRMARATGHRAIPTLQWFCAKATCPMVVDHTLTMRDRSHFTEEYATDLAPVLAPEIKAVLAGLSKGAQRTWSS